MTTNRIHLFFLALALLFWNPMSFHLLYSNTPSTTVKGIYIFYSITFFLGLAIAYLIYSNRVREKQKNLVLSFSILGILFGLLVIVNSFMPQVKRKEGLIFPPGSEVHFKTVEFDCKVLVNSVGVRDREFNLKKGNKFRIVCIGDSWTIGWGVNLEESYPKQLEKFLRGHGKDVEVINCGKAGADPETYISIMDKVLPVLKPDLVIVGLLQGDDLAQCYEHDSSFVSMATKPSGKTENFKKAIKSYLKSSVGNIIALFKPNKPLVVHQNWEQSANSVMNAFSAQQAMRFRTFPDTVQHLFKTGNLNPSLINFYLNFPDRMLVFNDPKNPATQHAIRKLNVVLHQMQLLCDANKVPLLVVNMPTSNFTGHQVIRTPLDAFDSYLQENNKVDSVYRALAIANNISYLQLTELFISLPDKTAYFYRFDGHPNAKGYHEIAAYIGQHIISMLPAE